MYNRWMELKKGSKDDDDDDDEVDVEHIVCSVCSQPDRDGNDILFCDRKGCYRAYHQNCLDPPYNSNNGDKEIDLDEDWFCWHCQCIDDCLDVIGEVLDDDHDDWQELFPEVKYMTAYGEKENFTCSSHNNDDLLILRYDSKDEEEDEDYVPSDDDGEEESLLNPEHIDDRDTSSIIDNSDDVEKTGDKKLIKNEENDENDIGDLKNDSNNGGQDDDGDDDEEEDDDDDDNDDDDDDDDDDFSELGIDEDEVKGLIKDAEEIDPDIMRVINDVDNNGDGRGDDDDGGKALYTYNKKRLRPRRNNNNNNNSIAMGDKRFMIEGVADKGKIIARVVRGVIQTGCIERVRISSADDDCLHNFAWIVRFDGDHQSFEVDYDQIMNYFDVYMDYTRLNHDDDNVNDNDEDGKDSKKRLVEMEGNRRLSLLV
jgi:hypothetical protein